MCASAHPVSSLAVRSEPLQPGVSGSATPAWLAAGATVKGEGGLRAAPHDEGWVRTRIATQTATAPT